MLTVISPVLSEGVAIGKSVGVADDVVKGASAELGGIILSYAIGVIDILDDSIAHGIIDK